MGNIKFLGKWNLQNKCWQKEVLESERGRTFAFGEYEKIINNSELSYDYIIIAHGSRVEDHSKNYTEIKETKIKINKIIEYFYKTKKNIIIKTFFMDADAPIIEDAKLLAQYIDTLALEPTTNSINLIGLSKCGAMAFNIPQFLKSSKAFSKTNIYTIATPFNGTKLASPKIFYPEIQKLIVSKLGDNQLAYLVSREIINLYEKVSSNSHMDYDIAMIGGIPESKLHCYDEYFIKNMLSNINIEAISKIKSYTNIITGIDGNTLREAIRTGNFIGIGLCILNDCFFDKKSDGMVMTESQKLVENVMQDVINKYTLVSSHHDVISNERTLSDILHIVDDTISEQKDQEMYRKRCLV